MNFLEKRAELVNLGDASFHVVLQEVYKQVEIAMIYLELYEYPWAKEGIARKAVSDAMSPIREQLTHQKESNLEVKSNLAPGIQIKNKVNFKLSFIWLF